MYVDDSDDALEYQMLQVRNANKVRDLKLMQIRDANS